MARLIDSNLWIDFFRTNSPRNLKAFIAPYVLDAESHLAEPVVFEVFRNCSENDAHVLTMQFRPIPFLSSPINLWSQGIDLGHACRRQGIRAGAMDLLIAAVAIHHDAELITFDGDFQKIASVSDLRVQLLKRPVLKI